MTKFEHVAKWKRHLQRYVCSCGRTWTMVEEDVMHAHVFRHSGRVEGFAPAGGTS